MKERGRWKGMLGGVGGIEELGVSLVGWREKKEWKKKRFPKKIILEFFYGGDGVYSQEKGLNGVSTSAVSGLENEK